MLRNTINAKKNVKLTMYVKVFLLIYLFSHTQCLCKTNRLVLGKKTSTGSVWNWSVYKIYTCKFMKQTLMVELKIWNLRLILFFIKWYNIITNLQTILNIWPHFTYIKLDNLDDTLLFISTRLWLYLSVDDEFTPVN